MLSTTQKTVIASSVTLVLGVPAAPAALVNNVLGASAAGTYSTDSANFTLLGLDGSTVGGTNDVAVAWDGGAYSDSSDYTGPGSVSNMTLSSTTPFFGYTWTAHDIQVFTPGTYSFDATLGGGVLESGTLTATVGPGQLGMHLLWDWNGGLNNDMFVVWDQGSVFGAGIGFSQSNTTTTSGSVINQCHDGTFINCLYDEGGFGPAGPPTGDQVWMFASSDPDGDGVMGVPMPGGGPIAGFNPNFNIPSMTFHPLPIPAAGWLLGSGLLGLAGIARRGKGSTESGLTWTQAVLSRRLSGTGCELNTTAGMVSGQR